MQKDLNLFDLCSGVGAGFPLAASVIGGFNIVGLCERDSYCTGILKSRYPGVRVYEDVYKLPSTAAGNINIITASPPCQPFSVAGKRQGINDSRDCFPAVVRFIRMASPQYFAIENVVGLLSCPLWPGAPKGSYFQQLIQDLSRGYSLEWITLPSSLFKSPFYRERLLLLGISERDVLPSRLKVCPPWTDSIRMAANQAGCFEKKGVPSSGDVGEFLRITYGLDGPIGASVGDRTNRKRRIALGNALDWRVATLALSRIIEISGIRR